MDPQVFTQIARCIADASLEGASEGEMLNQFCTGLNRAGIPVTRALLGADTLHPVLAGRIFAWHRDQPETVLHEFGRSISAEGERKWQESPFYHLEQSGAADLRVRMLGMNGAYPFPIVADLAAEGFTDYLVTMTRFGERAVIGQLDSIYASWSTDHAEGYSDKQIETLKALIPFAAAAIRSASVRRIADTLAETYLGRNAARRVLSGTIGRGEAERISAALWFSDLRGFTRLVDTVSPELIMPLLNDYAGAAVAAVHAHDGEVLKFMGDGVLAIFRAEGNAGEGNLENACRAALNALKSCTKELRAVRNRRANAGLPVTDMSVALHVGEVLYGNFGGEDRLDFTVVGPAVNELSRISGMARSVDQPAILSAAFRNAAGGLREEAVSLGRYALRGVEAPQELFTLDPTLLRV
ncbi:MAG: adenylate/guanylate cyclase domain-containing protein [Ferrovibrio sp.]|jgi:adenylate cyclase|uniref:adenylate/guanylate cyclase domain-containing protein n=1 Tax=Ferrovibrio sp. TaxID=1917215 RepID=UPI00391A4CCA